MRTRISGMIKLILILFILGLIFPKLLINIAIYYNRSPNPNMYIHNSTYVFAEKSIEGRDILSVLKNLIEKLMDVL